MVQLLFQLVRIRLHIVIMLQAPQVAKGETVSGAIAIKKLLGIGWTRDASGALVPPPAKEKAQDAVFTSTTTHEQQ